MAIEIFGKCYSYHYSKNDLDNKFEELNVENLNVDPRDLPKDRQRLDRGGSP